MNFYSVRDLRNDSKSIWENLKGNGEAIITNNGKPPRSCWIFSKIISR